MSLKSFVVYWGLYEGLSCLESPQCKVWGSGLIGRGKGIMVEGWGGVLRFRISGLGYLTGLGFGVWCLGFGVQSISGWDR